MKMPARAGWDRKTGQGWVDGFGYAGTFSHRPDDDRPMPRAFPIGFHVAAPGPSRDERGLPRIRVKAGSRPL